MSRFKVSNLPVARPGACYVTGRSSVESGPYLDTGMNIPGHGAVYLSRQVIEEAFDTLQKFQNKNGPSESEAEFFAKQKAELDDTWNNGYAAGFADAKNEMKELLNELVNSLGSGDGNSAVEPLSSLLADSTESSGEPEGSEPGTSSPSGKDAPAAGSDKSDGVSDDILGNLEL